MEIIYRGRCTGKTTDLIKRSSETGEYIVVNERSQALMVNRLAYELGFNIPFPITVDELLNTGGNGSSVYRDGVLVDEALEMLRGFLKVRINAVSISSDEIQNETDKGCSYCDIDIFNDEDRGKFIAESGYEDCAIIFKNGNYIIEVTGDDHGLSEKINYCPFCGRKLNNSNFISVEKSFRKMSHSVEEQVKAFDKLLKSMEEANDTIASELKKSEDFINRMSKKGEDGNKRNSTLDRQQAFGKLFNKRG